MAQREIMLATKTNKPEDLNLILKSYIVELKSYLPEIVLLMSQPHFNM